MVCANINFCLILFYSVKRNCIGRTISETTGHYPSLVLSDKIFRNRDNLAAYYKLNQIRTSGTVLGRPKKDKLRDKNRITSTNASAWRSIAGLAKRKCGLGLITTRREKAISHRISMSIFTLNLRKI